MRVHGTIRAIAFDAYGTLFDVYSIGQLAEELFPGHGKQIADLWRDKQIEYARLRTMCGRYADFWTVTGDALAYACERLGLDLDDAAQARLMHQYGRLKAHPENQAALQRLKAAGLPMAILSNGTPWMLESAVAAAGMDGLFDHVLSVHEVQRYKTAPEAYQSVPTASAAGPARSCSCRPTAGMSAAPPGSATRPSGSTAWTCRPSGWA